MSEDRTGRDPYWALIYTAVRVPMPGPENAVRAKMDGCRFGLGRDDDDGRSDDDGDGRLWSTNMACRCSRDVTLSTGTIWLSAGAVHRHCVAEAKEPITLGSTSLR